MEEAPKSGPTDRRMREKNPILEPFAGEFGEIPFGKIKTRHLMPAIIAGFKEAMRKLAAVRLETETPNFRNTVFALENCAVKLDTAMAALNVLSHNMTDRKIQAIEKKAKVLCARFENELYLDGKIFWHIQAVDTSHLKPEQKRLTEIFRRKFERYGAGLDPWKKEKLRAINEELASLSSEFESNLLAATNAFELVITDEKDLDGLPPSVRETAAIEAEKRGGLAPGSYLFTLHAPSLLPFLTYAKSRKLRRLMLRASGSRAFGGKFDNLKVVKEIAALRGERAKIMGLKTHAAYVLGDRMASEPQTVRKFIDDLFAYARPAAEKEAEELRLFAKETDGLKEMRSWDASYYAEKLRRARFDFDDEELRPFLRLEKVLDGAFALAGKLYGITFHPADVPVWHEDVRAFEVKDGDGSHLGLFYTDFFPRKSKRGGAWAVSLREQGYANGAVRRPHAGIFCNFTKPTPKEPSLLTFAEARTLFHEFGHALHFLFSDCIFRSLSTDHVLWDFIELPSQIMEGWLYEKEALDPFAAHYRTGEKIPDELIAKLKKARAFMAGYAALRQLSLAYLDMCWHDCEHPEPVADARAFENRAMKKFRIFPAVPDTCFSCSFAHIFPGGYSAGYYSYKWAEALAADAFEFLRPMKTWGLFREHILSRGHTEHPMDLYKKMRGREPAIDALLKKEGFIR